jgi:hypothetical protein
MATVYHRDQADAPTYAFGASSQLGFDALKLILKACLVVGYTGKAAAGWTLVAEGGQYIVLRNGSKTGYVCFSLVNTANYYVDVYVAATFAGVVNNIITGDGVKSGAATGNTVPQRFHVYFLVNMSTASSWYLVADAKSFMFSGIGFQNNNIWNATNDYDARSLYVGETTKGYFIAVGGTNSASAPTSFFSSNGSTFLRNPETGLLVDAGALSIDTPSLAIGGNSAIATTVPVAEAAFVPCDIYGGGVFAGYLRGVVLCPSTMFRTVNAAAGSFGLSAGIAPRSLNTSLNLGDGNSWFVGASCTSFQSRFLVTNKPEFWL